jgi:hypothetical protein
MKTVDFILETLSHLVRGSEGPPPGIPVHVEPSFERELVILCERQGLAAIVLGSLEKLALVPHLSTIAHRRLRTIADAANTRTRTYTKAIHNIAEEFASREVPIVFLNDGVVTSVYPSEGLRPVDKIDVLVKERDRKRVLDACAALGFRRVAPDPKFRGDGEALDYHQYFCPFDFVDSEGTRLQVRFRLFDFGAPDASEPAWSAIRPGDPSSGRPPAIGWTDQLVQSAILLNSYCFERLLCAVDIGLILRNHGRAIDWRAVEERLRQKGLTPSFTLTVDRVAGWLKLGEVSIPLQRPGAVRRKLFDAVWRPGFAGAVKDAPIRSRRVRYFLLESGSLRDKLKAFGCLIAPKPEWVAGFFGRPYTPWLRLRFVILALRRRLGTRPT